MDAEDEPVDGQWDQWDGYEEAEEPPEATPRAYNNTGVRVGEWWEAAAWSAENDGSRVCAARGSRPFGQRAALNDAATLARLGGHPTSTLTSWGHQNGWENDPMPANDRATRRALIEPPSTAEIQAALKGKGGVPACEETLLFATSRLPKPPGSGKRAVTNRPEPQPVAPFARDDTPASQQPPKLFSAVSNVQCIGEHAGLGAGLSAKPQRGSLVDLVGDVGEPTPRGPRRPAEAPPAWAMAPAPPVMVPPEARAAAFAAVGELAAVLADRHTDLLTTLRPYDLHKKGSVPLDSLMRVFRHAGLAPPPAMLRDLPSEFLTEAGVDYVALAAALPAGGDAPAALLSAVSDTQVGRRPHAHGFATPR